MIKHYWTIFCSRALIDKKTNNVSLIEVIEELKFDVGPEAKSPYGIPIYTQLVTLWAREEGAQPSKGQSKLTFHSPDGETMGEWYVEIDLIKHYRTRSLFHFSVLPAKGEGIHEWKVHLKKADEEDFEVVATVPIQITLMTPKESEDDIGEEQANRE